MKHLNKDLLAFLSQLKKHNEREWFETNKEAFILHKEAFKAFHMDVLEQLKQIDQIEKGKVYRIYRDVRFSKDKTPYKTYLAGSFKRATEQLRGGYYYQIEPGNSYVAGGFFGPNSQDLLHLRKQISQDSEPLREVLSSRKFKDKFGQLKGEQVKTSPKGFEKEDPNIDLLRYKQFLVYRDFSDETVMNDNFRDQVVETFRAMRPFFDVMSMYLTTDLNGIPLQ